MRDGGTEGGREGGSKEECKEEGNGGVGGNSVQRQLPCGE
jgi:hypothetical protein